ncbi:hypothetical protein GCM10029964_065680 [Kibdelosporangium lantanae]
MHFNPIAAGEVLLDSRRSTVATHLRDNYEDAVAVEMESAGLANAGQLNEDTPVLAIRGISDFADGAKDRTGEPEVAADNAAAFAMAVIANLTDICRPREERASRASDRPTVRNIASGRAQVGNQFGIVHGNAHVGTPHDLGGS